jgi:putative transferase (TIGR04331 family)
MFLITTADQRFWKTDEPILFLGEWCKLYSQKSVWKELSYEVLPYHWDDRKKLYQDYIYLNMLYEKTLLQMRDLLNQIHGVNHSVRYWRIVIGLWLYYFIQILYDRYQSVVSAIESGKVTNTLIGKNDETIWLPRDFPSFVNWFMDDGYNHHIYSRIIEFTGRMPFEVAKTEDGREYNQYTGNAKHLFVGKTVLKKLIYLYERLIPDRLNQVVLISSYLSTFDLIKFQFSLRQLPYLLPPDVEVPEAGIDLDTREKLFFRSSKNEFEKLLAKMIKEQIPLIYVEGYAQMNEHSLRAYPKKPKIIFTANAWWVNETFKFWTAYHFDLGVKFVGTQYGGHYGTGLWSCLENHEIQIYDRYYTWGWKSDVYKNTKPLAAAKLNKAKRVIRPKKNGRILLVLASQPRYFYHMYSAPAAASGTLSYFDDQYWFVRALSKENQKLLLVRLYQRDYGWNQMKRWNSEFPGIECCLNNKSMLDQLEESRLVVCTYNATTYLETFVANFPTVIFWNPEHWELRSSAKPYFDELRNVGILHDTPGSAAAKVNAISHDPTSWWNQPEIQKAKDQFCFQFARTSINWLKEWKSELLESI